MKKSQAILVDRQVLGPGLVSMWLEFNGLGAVEPGQFFQFATDVRFLPRAISVADRVDNRLLFVVRVVGHGTRWLSDLSTGSTLKVLGPLGHGMEIPEQGPVMLLGGGVGSAPLLYLARKLHQSGIEVDALLAASCNDQMILVQEFETCCRNVTCCTDDGSCGLHGLLPDVLADMDLADMSGKDQYRQFYACGPEPMFSALKRMELPQPVYAFLESRMGCGTGLCVGCAVKGTDGTFHRVCTEGPVFMLKDIDV